MRLIVFSSDIGPKELYNEELTDLLAAPVDDAKTPEAERKPLRLFEDATGKRGVMVSGLEEILCTSAREVFKVCYNARRGFAMLCICGC